MFSGKLQLFLAVTLLNWQCEPDNLRYSFLVEWYDAEASLLRSYYLFYFPVDGSIELFDPKYNRLFLKRLVVPGVTLDQLHEGGSVHIYGRLMHIRSFGDDYTRKRLSVVKQRTFAMVKPDGVRSMGDIINSIYDNGFTITKLKMTQMSGPSAASFYGEHKGKPFFEPLMQYVTSGSVLAMELVAENAVARWRSLIGPTDPCKAREMAPESLRARYGTDMTSNALHGSDSPEAATKELAHFFPDGLGHRSCEGACACGGNSTCCIVLPHLIKAYKLGHVVNAINEGGFRISNAQMFYMEEANAQEFYEVYKGVVPEYSEMVSHLVSGPCVAMEITGGDDVPRRFRNFCGPRDPEMARHLRPGSLRARFGENRVCMGVHCSDLPEDGPLEVEYFFKILQ